MERIESLNLLIDAVLTSNEKTLFINLLTKPQSEDAEPLIIRDTYYKIYKKPFSKLGSLQLEHISNVLSTILKIEITSKDFLNADVYKLLATTPRAA